ncbi:MAG: hypothetical protein KME55_40680 [Nostoc indistinguendum CM1-VF10]|nr:hypothetical protein [Nostoc indistinguendum CM1-VF10]
MPSPPQASHFLENGTITPSTPPNRAQEPPVEQTCSGQYPQTPTSRPNAHQLLAY